MGVGEMLFLLLAIVSSSSVALLFKYSELKRMNHYQVIMLNYLTAAAVSFVMIQFDTVPLFVPCTQPLQALVGNFTGNLTDEGSFVAAVLLGILAGVLYFMSLYLYPRSIRQTGAALTGMADRLGTIVPLVVSVVVWNEIPLPLQWVGIVLLLLAMLLVNVDFSHPQKSTVKFCLLWIVLVSGAGNFANKLFQKYALLEYKNHFLLFLYFTAFLVSAVLFIKNRSEGFSLKGVLVSICVGVPNCFSAFFLLLALSQMPAAIAYPVYSAGGITLLMILSFVFYHEKFKPNEAIAVALTIAGLVLVNL